MLISLLVVASGPSPELRVGLRRLRSQLRGLDAELVLVLNCAPEGGVDEDRGSGGEAADRTIFEPEVGKSNGLNRGVAECRGEVIAFADDDGLPRPGWLAAITRPLLEDDRPAALVGCGGRVLPVLPERGTPRWYRRLVEDSRNHFLGPKHDLGDEVLDYRAPAIAGDKLVGSVPLGASCAYRREVFATRRFEPRLGPNRATGHRGGEDFAFAMQLLTAGFRIQYRPDAVMEHPVAAERLTLDYARRGYFINGVEEIRIRRLLGLPLPAEELLLARLHKRRLRPWRRLTDPGGWARRQLRARMAQGMLRELRDGR